MKTIEENFVDWESYHFGFGYGTGEDHTLPAIKRFFDLIGSRTDLENGYDYRTLETELTPTVAWLLINILCHADVIDYGTSPRGGWLTPQGKALKKFISTKTADQLIDLCCSTTEDYHQCMPDVCNCGPNGYEAGKKCFNPFWDEDDARKWLAENKT